MFAFAENAGQKTDSQIYDSKQAIQVGMQPGRCAADLLRLVRLSSNMIRNIVLELPHDLQYELINSCACTGWFSICTRADAVAADQLWLPGLRCSNHAAVHH